MALILNIDTSSKSTSVALAKDGKLLQLLEEHEVVSHASKLTPFISTVMKSANKEFKELDAIAISIGPGSYTGLRIGLSSAKGLSYALKIPIIAISGLEAMIIEMQKKYSSNNELLVSTMDSRKNELYCSWLEINNEQISKPEAVVLNDDFYNFLKGKKTIIAGSGSNKMKEFIQNDKIEYDTDLKFSATNMITSSYNAYLNKEFNDLAYLEPEYLKPFITT